MCLAGSFTFKSTKGNMKTSLYYREGSSDKEYHVELVPGNGLFLVNFAFGRRGSALNTGCKTPSPVDETKAKEIFAKLVREKKAKGYTEGEDGTPYQNGEAAGRVSGRMPQLLNPIEEHELETYIAQRNWCMQEKFDGKRLLLLKEGSSVQGINRKGLFVGIPATLVQSGLMLPWNFVIDGEAVGDVFHPFDLLEYEGESVRNWTYADRFRKLGDMLIAAHPPHFDQVRSVIEREEKREFLRRLKNSGAEGVVFKNLEATFSPGRPASGGSQLKHKFYADGSFVVEAVNTNRRSVALCLYDGETAVNVGNVTVPPNQPIPQPPEIVQVRYLYAFPESRALFQPVYQWRRDDLEPNECTLDQLKFKRGEAGDDDQ
jgi:bifunctional non-homologous end joining protein LigD